jgi:alpha-2-macroglobulin
VTRTPVYPWWWGYYGWASETKGQTVATGSALLGADGRFSFTFTPNADERLEQSSKGITYRYAVNADVMDEGGETRSASRAFRLGFVAVEATVQTENEIGRAHV